MSRFFEFCFEIGLAILGLLFFLYCGLCIALVTAMWFPKVNVHLQICTFYVGGSTCIGGRGETK